MSSQTARKLTLFDAMVLTAATAIALLPIRYLLHHGQILSVDNVTGTPNDRLRNFLELMVIVSPVVVPWCVALCLLRVKRPRPTLGRAFRQPGTAACAAVTLIAFFAVARIIGSLTLGSVLEPNGGWDIVSYIGTTDKIAVFIIRTYIKLGESVAVVWIILWLSRTWQAEASWIDRTGRAPGVFCMVTSVLFGWSFAIVWD